MIPGGSFSAAVQIPLLDIHKVCRRNAIFHLRKNLSPVGGLIPHLFSLNCSKYTKYVAATQSFICEKISRRAVDPFPQL